MNKNEILLRRRNKVLLIKGQDRLPEVYIASMMKNLESLGFTFSSQLIEVLRTLSIKEVTNFYKDTLKIIKEMLGAHVYHKPMYPNFPKQVMHMDQAELYINAIIHYVTYGQLLPKYEKEERKPLIDNHKLRVIGLGSNDEFLNIFINLLNSKTSLSETDKKDIAWFFVEYPEKIIALLPPEIPLKENAAYVSYLLLKHVEGSEEILKKYLKTATDVLRLAVTMSNGDISLAENTYFRSFKRKERRLLLCLLENYSNIEEDMLRYKNSWIRLGERLHPTEYRTRYPKTSEAFYKIRNNIKIPTFKGTLEKAFEEQDIRTAVALLSQRPGEFARNLDKCLRIAEDKQFVIDQFDSIANKVSSTVLLQLKEHLLNRNVEKEIRVFFPKGNVAKAYSLENNLQTIEDYICQNIVEICKKALIEIYSLKKPLGKVFIDQRLKDYLVPFSQRSANKAFKTIVRGSKLPIAETTNTIRGFIYWKQAKDDIVDIDLSAVMYDEDWNYLEHISYTNLKSSKYNACHSGDIVDAPEGASEFIDLDIESIKTYGGRYIMLCIHSYSGQTFDTIPECFVGWMSRECPNSGEIYEEKTVENKADITSNTQICVPMIIDVVEDKVIWTDLALKRHPKWCNNVEGNAKGIVLMGKAMTNLIKANLYDLFLLNALARGEITSSKKDADIVFSVEDGITPFDTDEIIGKYL